jgi:hypothetical protein
MPLPPARDARRPGPVGSPPCAARCGGGVCAAGADERRFDAAKVARMQEALRRGTFEVNAEAIADRLLARAGTLARPLN